MGASSSPSPRPRGDTGSLATTPLAGCYQDCTCILAPGCPGTSAMSWERATFTGAHRHVEDARGWDPPLHPAPPWGVCWGAGWCGCSW